MQILNVVFFNCYLRNVDINRTKLCATQVSINRHGIASIVKKGPETISRGILMTIKITNGVFCKTIQFFFFFSEDIHGPVCSLFGENVRILQPR